MKTYAILYYDFCGNMAVFTVAGKDKDEARQYALDYYGYFINERNIIKVVKI